MVAFPIILLASLSLPHSSEKKKSLTNNDIGSTLRDAVVSDRNRRTAGVLAGSVIFVAGGGIGVAAGILEVPEVLIPITAVAVGVAAWTNSLQESNNSLEGSNFIVKDSEIPRAGQGLFAAQRIKKGAYFFPYIGERLTEKEYFERYPDGQGRYVAELPSPPWSFDEPIYVDAVDDNRSGLARWMNSKPSDSAGCNVIGKKSIAGERNLYFYAARDIAEGEELCFDYGINYWDAVIDE